MGLFFFLLFCNALPARGAEPLPYPVLDSKVLAPRIGGSVHWLDNRRVVFVGYREIFEVEDKVLRKDSYAKGSWLGIWDVASGEIKVHKRSVGAINCFNGIDQSIIYMSWNDKEKAGEWFVGRYPDERSFGVQNIALDIDLLECAYPRKRDYPGELQGKKYVTRLLEGHGYLGPVLNDMGNTNTPWGLYDTQGMKVTELPAPPLFLRYYPFKNAYFINKGTSSYRGARKSNGRITWSAPGRAVLISDDPHVGWWVYPSGKVEEVKIPPRTQIRPNEKPYSQTMDFSPTKTGVFFPFNTLDDVSGGYLARGEKLVKVIGGALYQIAVSPDGCKVAFLHNPAPTKALREWIKAIDFCKSTRGGRK